MLRFISFPTAQEAQTAATQLLQDTLSNLIHSQTPVLLLLSGGGNIPVAAAVERKILHHPSITRMVLDERFTADPQPNNSLLLRAAGIDVVPTVPEPQETLGGFAQRFAKLLQTWLSTHPTGKIVCTMGMGADGHIAGISPFPNNKEQFTEVFLDSNELALGYSGGLTPPQRVTVTPHFFTQYVNEMIGLVTGTEKQVVLQELQKQTTEPHVHPAQLLHTVNSNITIITDQTGLQNDSSLS